ncbi:MAG: IclR family transcriptional regulator [Granulosicoccus sp.]
MVKASDTENRTAKNSTVARVLDILSAIAAADRPLSPTEIAETLSLPKASVHRLCTTLEEQGYLQTRMSGRGLQAGRCLQTLALGVLSAAPFQAQRRTILKSLSEEIGETCNIAVPEGAEMIYFDRAETHWPVRINLQVGSRVPAYATAGGKMYLSTLSEARLDRILKNTRLQRYTQNTLVTISALQADLEAVAKRGYSLDNEEYLDGMVAMAVPVVNSSGRLYATLSFHAPCMRVPFSAVSSFLPQLQAASKQLSALVEDD